jgi:transposase-like protein
VEGHCKRWAKLANPDDDRSDDEPSALREKDTDADVLREMIGFPAHRLMELEIKTLTGVAHGELSAQRINQRNGYRDRD